MTELSQPRPDPAVAPHDLSDIVLANDVRGRADDQLTVEVARALGAAFADSLESPELIVAHDMRRSSPALSQAVIEGAVRRGAIVADAGLASTDQLYCASGLHRAAAVMITASHNPPQDNGLKLCLPGARRISRDTGLGEIGRAAEAYLDAGEIPVRGEGRAEEIDTLDDYARTLLELAPVPEGRPLRVVVDAGSGMAGHTAPAVLGRLPQIEMVGLHLALDGDFPHHPADPLRPENLRDLQEAVLRERADLGLAFDGDADRCVVLDETGTAVTPSALTALIARREIASARAAGETRPVVVANLVTSRHVAETIREAGGEHVRTPVGHSLIKETMAARGAVFGGEHSAHYYFRDFFHADSGMLAALHVLAALAETDAPSSALVAAHSPYAASGEINTRVEDAARARERVRERLGGLPGARIDDLDGLTVEHWDEERPAEERWWFTLRSSNTEPLLRLNVEAEQDATMERIRDEVLALVREDAVGLTTADRTEPDPMEHEDRARHEDGARHEQEAADEQGPADEQGADPLAVTAPAVDGGIAAPVGPPSGASGADVPGWVRAILRCPDCGGELRDTDRAMRCEVCRRVHPVEGGIPVLIAGRHEAPPSS
ncbi:phosphomannomutase/phosphoglucomutase [Brachybacterium sp. AOP43-C2-M15]|uniref:phosphomannomutase/phosphoglucomutase n=1 Tax=Brachybacterium sp. AOP43-C2-M15 TaxID=3457661 RepID=UPI004033D614